MNESERLDRIEARVIARVIALEERAMHIDHLLNELNGVVCSLQDGLGKQNEAINHLTEISRRLAAGESEKRTLEDERPPHY